MLMRIVEEVSESIENECFIAALALALTIPDICGKAEFPAEKSTKKRYIDWYDQYIGYYEEPVSPYSSDMPYPSGELIYSLRNSMLHQGTPNVDSQKVKEDRCKVDKFVLTVADAYDGGTSRVSYRQGYEITERALEVNLVNLCTKLCATAKGYFEENSDKFNFFLYELQDRRVNDGNF